MEEKKKRKAIYDYEASRKYRQEKQTQISLSFKNEDYTRYKSYAETHGMKFREFIVKAIEEKIERG